MPLNWFGSSGSGWSIRSLQSLAPPMNPVWKAPMRSNAEPWPPSSYTLVPRGSRTVTNAIIAVRTSSSVNDTVGASPRHTCADHAPEKQSACCSVYTVGSLRSRSPVRPWMAWPNSWASTTATTDGPYESASWASTPWSPSS